MNLSFDKTISALGVMLVLGSAVSALTFARDHRTAQACLCKTPESPMAELASSDVVFRGAVVADIPAPDNPNDRRVTFAVSKAWKGPDRSTFDVFTPLSNECRISFQIGSDYLVYARNRNVDGSRPPGCAPQATRLFTDRCSRTKMFDAEEAAKLECPPPVSAMTQAQIEKIALRTYGLERNPEVPARVVSVNLKAHCEIWRDGTCLGWSNTDEHAPLWTVVMYGPGICTPRCPPPIRGAPPCDPPRRNGFSVTINGNTGYVTGGGCIDLPPGAVHWLFLPLASSSPIDD